LQHRHRLRSALQEGQVFSAHWIRGSEEAEEPLHVVPETAGTPVRLELLNLPAPVRGRPALVEALVTEQAEKHPSGMGDYGDGADGQQNGEAYDQPLAPGFHGVSGRLRGVRSLEMVRRNSKP